MRNGVTHAVMSCQFANQCCKKGREPALDRGTHQRFPHCRPLVEQRRSVLRKLHPFLAGCTPGRAIPLLLPVRFCLHAHIPVQLSDNTRTVTRARQPCACNASKHFLSHIQLHRLQAAVTIHPSHQPGVRLRKYTVLVMELGVYPSTTF
jgi:hypothetical protein